MKAFTDLEQGRKLTEILPIESADMYWWFASANITNERHYYIEAMDDADFNEEEGHIRAWSLAALLDILPKIHTLKPLLDLEDCSIMYSGTDICISASNPIDACYETILKLHELKML